MSKAATKAELAHMAKVKNLPCIVCDKKWYNHMIESGFIANTRTQFRICDYDHLVDGSKRLGHMFGLPLCKAHHLGKKKYAGGIPWDSSKPNQWKLLEKLYKVLGKEIPEYTTKGRNNFKQP